MKHTLSNRFAGRSFTRTSLAVATALLIAAATPTVSWADGNVTAEVTSGDLVIRGDGAGNAFSLVPGDELDTIRVGGFDGTTTVNGGDAFNATGVTGDLRIALRGGDDQVNLIDLDIPGSISITGGSGDDAIGIEDSAPTGDLAIDTGPGNDSVATSSGAEGDVDVETGGGDDELLLEVGAIRVTVDTGSGNDNFTICCPFPVEEWSVKMRSGADHLTIQGAFGPEDFAGPAVLNGGSDVDTFTDDQNQFARPPEVINFEIIEVVPAAE